MDDALRVCERDGLAGFDECAGGARQVPSFLLGAGQFEDVAEVSAFDERECELVDIVAPTGPSLKIWRRLRK